MMNEKQILHALTFISKFDHENLRSRSWVGLSLRSHRISMLLIPIYFVSNQSDSPFLKYIYASLNKTLLVQIMGCRMFGAKPLSEPMLDYCQVVEQISVKLESNTIFSQENASENVVCKMSAILSGS